jgi:hypothetical protein
VYVLQGRDHQCRSSGCIKSLFLSLLILANKSNRLGCSPIRSSPPRSIIRWTDFKFSFSSTLDIAARLNDRNRKFFEHKHRPRIFTGKGNRNSLYFTASTLRSRDFSSKFGSNLHRIQMTPTFLLCKLRLGNGCTTSRARQFTNTVYNSNFDLLLLKQEFYGKYSPSSSKPSNDRIGKLSHQCR